MNRPVAVDASYKGGRLMKVVIKFCVVFALLTSLAIGHSHAMGQFFFLENPLIGERAPDFTLKTTKGRELNFSDYREGRDSIIFYWATWCASCKEHLQEMKTAIKEFEERGISVVFINLEEKEKVVKKFMKKASLDFEMLLDEDAKVAEDYNIFGLPTYYLVNKAGVIVAIEHGIPENYVEILAGVSDEE